MKSRRKFDVADPPPDYEDRGLFKTPPSRLDVSLVPKIWRNKRDDWLIRGHVFGDTAVEVLFAGRRRKAAEPLIEHIRVIWSRANHALAPGKPPLEIDSVRYPIVVTGSWRIRFEMDKSGWQSRHYQLVVAQWTPADARSEVVLGDSPMLSRPF